MTRPAMANMRTGLGRAAETQEVFDFIMYLTSDKAAAITGSNHFIDCGRTAMPPA
jgi:enoyl-[acyl-carrier-protein] reductase (NADH)